MFTDEVVIMLNFDVCFTYMLFSNTVHKIKNLIIQMALIYLKFQLEIEKKNNKLIIHSILQIIILSTFNLFILLLFYYLHNICFLIKKKK